MNQTLRGILQGRSRARGTEEKPAAMKYIWLAVLLCFLAGIVGANLMDREQLGGFGIWNTFFLEKFKYAPVRSEDLFYYVLRQRMPVLAVLLIFAFNNWGTVAGGEFQAWQSFAAGFLMAASVAVYGVKGILLMGTAFFPQYLLYIPLYIAVFYLSAYLRQRGGVRFGGHGTGGRRVKRMLLFAGLCAVLLAVHVAGIFLESYVNPFLLKKILKFF